MTAVEKKKNSGGGWLRQALPQTTRPGGNWGERKSREGAEKNGKKKKKEAER